ncbi:MAG TPA: OBAP family protein [Thermoanaerobaculia bacterium]|nr:OBAP family protein [Thermoanaerobaculia bacterium]
MKRMLSVLLLLLAVACGGENTPPRVDVPGAPKDAKTRVLETGAAVMQDKTPLSMINIYMDGFHFYSGDLAGQMEAHHYCTKVNEDLTQCVIFDGNGESARLMGVEYIVSAKLFATLPPDEKKLWHSHRYEVKSGALIAPGIPDLAEHEFMEKLVSTYGKTWHTWHTDRATPLPTGIPQLMAGFTADGQLRPELLAARDARFGVRTAEKRQQRADIADTPVDPQADTGLRPDAPQLQLGTGTHHH